MYNLELRNKQIRKFLTLPFDDIESDNEWIIEEGHNVVEFKQTQVEDDDEDGDEDDDRDDHEDLGDDFLRGLDE